MMNCHKTPFTPDFMCLGCIQIDAFYLRQEVTLLSAFQKVMLNTGGVSIVVGCFSQLESCSTQLLLTLILLNCQ